MIFIWGKKIQRTKQGYAVDFCPYCREFRRMQLFRVGKAGHVYFVALGKGDYVYSEAVCLDCHGMKLVNADEYAEIVTKKREAASLETLAARTNPDLEGRWADRWREELQIREDPFSVDPGVRSNLIAEPIHEGAAQAEAIMKGGIYFDWQLSATIVGAGLIFVAVFQVLEAMELSYEDWYELALSGVAILGVIVSIIMAKTSRGRRVRKVLIPLLQGALRPLRPTRQEIAAVLRGCRHLAIGQKLRADDLVPARRAKSKK